MRILALIPLLLGAGEPIRIAPPPDQPVAGRHFLVQVQGLSPNDTTTARIITEPKATTAVGVAGWNRGQQFLWLAFPEPGRCMVAVAVIRDGGIQYGSASFTVRGTAPNPPPPPIPGELFIGAIYESQGRPAEEAVNLSRLRAYLETSETRSRLADRDEKLPDGSKPSWITAFLNRAPRRRR